MSHEFPPDPLVLIVGPTGVGKTRFAITLAKEFKSEIIAADSRSFYRGMDIGTAKPSREDLAAVSHHLVDIADPDETINLSVFLKLVKETIADIHSRNRLPILVGGTGQYVRSILEGWQVPEGEPDHRLRKVLEDMAIRDGPHKLHTQLAIVDPDAARSIDPANVRRTIRALEVVLSTGTKFSDQRKRGGCPYSTIMIGLTLPRAELYARVDERIECMVRNGLMEETEKLVEKGFGWELPAMSAIGYKEMGLAIRGEITETDAIDLMKKRTRIFIRRQVAWFQPDNPNIHWYNANNDILPRVVELLGDPQAWKKKTA